MLLGIFYCPPNSDSAYMSKVFDSWEKATDENKTTSARGDFNKNWLNDEDSACMRYMLTFVVLLRLLSRLHGSATCLDLRGLII